MALVATMFGLAIDKAISGRRSGVIRMAACITSLLVISHVAHGGPILDWDQTDETGIFVDGIHDTIVTGFDVTVHWGPDAEDRPLFLDFIQSNSLCLSSAGDDDIGCVTERLEYFEQPDACPGLCITGLRWTFWLTYTELADFDEQIANRAGGRQRLFGFVLNPVCCIGPAEPTYLWFSNTRIYGLDRQVLLAVPEPATFSLILVGLVVMLIGRRRQRPFSHRPT